MPCFLPSLKRRPSGFSYLVNLFFFFFQHPVSLPNLNVVLYSLFSFGLGRIDKKDDNLMKEPPYTRIKLITNVLFNQIVGKCINMSYEHFFTKGNIELHLVLY